MIRICVVALLEPTPFYNHSSQRNWEKIVALRSRLIHQILLWRQISGACYN